MFLPATRGWNPRFFFQHFEISQSYFQNFLFFPTLINCKISVHVPCKFTRILHTNVNPSYMFHASLLVFCIPMWTHRICSMQVYSYFAYQCEPIVYVPCKFTRILHTNVNPSYMFHASLLVFCIPMWTHRICSMQVYSYFAYQCEPIVYVPCKFTRILHTNVNPSYMFHASLLVFCIPMWTHRICSMQVYSYFAYQCEPIVYVPCKFTRILHTNVNPSYMFHASLLVFCIPMWTHRICSMQVYSYFAYQCEPIVYVPCKFTRILHTNVNPSYMFHASLLVFCIPMWTHRIYNKRK